jgi:hypothetical protein
MNYHLIALLILILGFIFYCHIYQYIKHNNKYEILQVSNPTPDNLERALLDKTPLIITDVVDEWDGINMIDKDYIKIQPDLTKDKVVVKLLDKYCSNYLLPFKISQWYGQNISKTNQLTQLKKINGHRHYIVQLQGKTRYILFNPSQNNNIYNGNVNIWKWNEMSKEEKDKYPNFNKASYVELLLTQGKILYLPKDWWIASQCLEDSIQLTIDSNSIFSFFIK